MRVGASGAPGYRAIADINTVLSDDAAFRVNLMGNDSAVTDRDYVRNRRVGVAPSIAYGIGTEPTFTLSYCNQEEDDIPITAFRSSSARPPCAARDLLRPAKSDDRSALTATDIVDR